MKARRLPTLRLLNWAGFLITIAANALAVALPLNGKTTAELSEQYPNLFVPAGLTFSVWGAIYLGLLLFTLYQSGLLGGGAAPAAAAERVGALFFLASLANAAWLFLWHYELPGLALVDMLALLGLLIAVYLRLAAAPDGPRRERWLLRAPFGLYLGWISVATVANVTAVLVDAGWGGWGLSQDVWAAVMASAAGALGAVMLLWRKDAAYGLVIVWALAGIVLKHVTDFHFAYPAVPAAAAVGIGVNLALLAYTAARRARPARG